MAATYYEYNSKTTLSDYAGLFFVFEFYISHFFPVIFTPPARRAWRSIKFAPFLFYFFPVSKVGLPLMGDTAFLCCLAHCDTSFKPFHSRICLQNTHFNVYTEISKQKQGSPCKNSRQMF